jgi:cytochrome c553
MKTKFVMILMFALFLAASAAQAEGDPNNGQALAVSAGCGDCHGDDGKGDDESPALAGMAQSEFIDALKGYASGELEDESGMMADYAKDLSEQEMVDLAAYYAGMGR